MHQKVEFGTKMVRANKRDFCTRLYMYSMLSVAMLG